MERIRVPELDDWNGTLGDLQEIVAVLITRHGEATVLELDAGHNNVTFRLLNVEKKRKKKSDSDCRPQR